MGTLMGTLWAQAHRLSARVLNLNKEMARRKGFEPLTPRFEAWGRPLKSLRFVTVKTHRSQFYPASQAHAAPIVTERLSLSCTFHTQ